MSRKNKMKRRNKKKKAVLLDSPNRQPWHSSPSSRKAMSHGKGGKR